MEIDEKFKNFVQNTLKQKYISENLIEITDKF